MHTYYICFRDTGVGFKECAESRLQHIRFAAAQLLICNLLSAHLSKWCPLASLAPSFLKGSSAPLPSPGCTFLSIFGHFRFQRKLKLLIIINVIC